MPIRFGSSDFLLFSGREHRARTTPDAAVQGYLAHVPGLASFANRAIAHLPCLALRANVFRNGVRIMKFQCLACLIYLRRWFTQHGALPVLFVAM